MAVREESCGHAAADAVWYFVWWVLWRLPFGWPSLPAEAVVFEHRPSRCHCRVGLARRANEGSGGVGRHWYRPPSALDCAFSRAPFSVLLALAVHPTRRQAFPLQQPGLAISTIGLVTTLFLYLFPILLTVSSFQVTSIILEERVITRHHSLIHKNI